MSKKYVLTHLYDTEEEAESTRILLMGKFSSLIEKILISPMPYGFILQIDTQDITEAHLKEIKNEIEPGSGLETNQEQEKQIMPTAVGEQDKPAEKKAAPELQPKPAATTKIAQEPKPPGSGKPKRKLYFVYLGLLIIGLFIFGVYKGILQGNSQTNDLANNSESTPTTIAYTSTPLYTSTATARTKVFSSTETLSSPGTLTVNCNQDGGSIYIGTELYGTTNSWSGSTVSGLLPGTYTFKITDAGYKDWSKQITINGNQTTTIYTYLESGSGPSTTRNETILPAANFGTLKVSCNQTGGNIYINGEFDGTTDNWSGSTVSGLLPGTYTFKITNAGYKDWSKQITINANQTTTIYTYLESGSGSSITRNETILPTATFGTLKVSCNQTGGSIYVDGEFDGTTDNWSGSTVSGLLPGTYTFKITNAGYKDWSKQITINANQTTTIYTYLESGSGSSTTRNETILPTATFGTLKVSCNQTGGSIYVDGEFDGTTDNWSGSTVNGLLPGTYTFKITNAGYKDWSKQITINANQTTTIYTYLESGSGSSTTRNETILPAATFGTLKVSCNQTGGSIYVDGEFDGTTDNWSGSTVSGLLPGTYTFKIADAGYKDWSKQITINGNQTTTIYTYLESGSGPSTTRNETILPAATFGTLKVSCNQTGGNIYVDGEFDGTTDNWSGSTVSGLLPGTYTFKITNAGYKDWSKQITINANQTTTIYTYLESGSGSSTTRNETILPAANFGTLKVSCNQTGGNIYINGEFDGTTDNWSGSTVSGLLPGTYTLKITNSAYKDWTGTVTIMAGQTTTITVTLTQ